MSQNGPKVSPEWPSNSLWQIRWQEKKDHEVMHEVKGTTCGVVITFIKGNKSLDILNTCEQ